MNECVEHTWKGDKKDIISQRCYEVMNFLDNDRFMTPLKFLESIKDERDKVQLFWEGHKNLRHPPYGFDIYLVNVKIFVAFSEKLNFKYDISEKV